MYRLTYQEYFSDYFYLSSMAPASEFYKVCREHTKQLTIPAETDPEAVEKAREFIEASRGENEKKLGSGWPHTPLELVKVLQIRGENVPGGILGLWEEAPSTSSG